MISSHHCSWLKPVSFSSYSPFWEKKGQPSSSSSSSSYSSGYIVCSLEKDQSQQHFEVDQEKAREALKKLDQQLQSLSQKQLRSPKIKASDVKLTRRRESEYEESEVEVASEFSASFLAYTAGLLFLLTIFYNILFITVIKPSIDIPDQPPTTAIQRDIMS